MTGCRAAVVITTKNRREELRVAIESSLRQSAATEVLVLDDGSTDGTADMVQHDYPMVRLRRAEASQGYIWQRNLGAELASAPIIFSIDDDAAFSSPRTVAQTLGEFDHPRVGAVAIPYVDVRTGPEVKQCSPAGNVPYVTDAYRGTAYAVRREVFQRLGGYRVGLFHQGEERDFCVRMLDAGWVVRLGTADPVHHFESPRRDLRRMHVYGRRNDVLFAWHNVPMPYFPVHLAGTVFKGLVFGLNIGQLRCMFEGVLKGCVACATSERGKRAPIDRRTYTLARELRARGPMALPILERHLPPLEKAAWRSAAGR